jgi:hypothetical protein
MAVLGVLGCRQGRAGSADGGRDARRVPRGFSSRPATHSGPHTPCLPHSSLMPRGASFHQVPSCRPAVLTTPHQTYPPVFSYILTHVHNLQSRLSRASRAPAHPQTRSPQASRRLSCCRVRRYGNRTTGHQPSAASAIAPSLIAHHRAPSAADRQTEQHAASRHVMFMLRCCGPPARSLEAMAAEHAACQRSINFP